MNKFYRFRKFIFFLFCFFISRVALGQGNRLSIVSSGPKQLSICGSNDSASVEIYNISSATVSSITVKLILPLGINYVKGTVSSGATENNISNLNQPVFSISNLLIARNTVFKVLLSADCGLLPYLNANNTPYVSVRADYTGNYDIGASIPFSVKVPSVQFSSITNLSYTGDIGSKFSRTITIGNFGKGPLKSITLTRINGKDLKTYYVSKGSTAFKGDTTITVFGSSFFKTIGNLDTFLDQNETVTFTDSSRIFSCKNLNTAYELAWGCNSKFCQVAKTSGSAIIGNSSPNLVAIPLPVTPTCFANSTFQSEVRFANTGNMPAKSPRVSISLNYPYMTSTYDTGSIRIRVGYKGAWKKTTLDSTTPTYNQGYYSCIGTNPIGFFRIKCPDLQPNDTLYVIWNTQTCVPAACINGIFVVNSWAYYAEYKDQCSNTKTIPWTWGKVYDYHYFAASTFTPTDLVDKQVGEFRILITSVNLLPRTSTAGYIVDLILPKGLTHSKLKKDLYFVNADLNANWNPDSIVMKGDTLRGYFPHPIPINLTNSELVFYLKADCSKSGANGKNTVTMQIRYNPDKSCRPREWYYLTCQDINVKIHCFSSCNGGMKFKNFSVQRINFGRPDNNNDGLPDVSGTLDTLKVREERCMTGDTVMAIYTGIVKRTSSIVSWRHAYIESTVTYGKYLDIAGIQLIVYRLGVRLSVNCSQVKSWKTLSGNDATFKIDISTDSLLACVSSSFRYSMDDSVIVKVKYRVSTNIGGSVLNLFFNNRFYTSPVNNPTTNANKFQCDTFSGQMVMAGYYFTTCCSDIYQLNSCSQLAVNNYFYLGIGTCCSNYGGNNYFPYEYRNFAKLKAINFNIPPGFTQKSAFLAQYRTSGSNKTAFENKDSIQPKNKNARPLQFDVAGYYKDSAKGVINLSDDGFHGYFVSYIEPSCEIQAGNAIPVNYDFIFERLNTLGNGFDTVSGYDQLVYNKPVTTINPVSPTIYAAQDTAEWEIVYTNYSASFSNINTWFAPDNSGAIKIVQIRDAAKDTLLPSSNGIFKAGTMPYNNTRKFKVRAVYNSCKKDSVILYSGWNCQSYPNNLASYNCQKDRIALYLEPQNTQFQATLTDSTNTADLCASTPYTYVLENTGATTGYNTKAVLNLPIGMSVVAGSCYLRYPHKGSRVAIPTPVLKSGTTYEWNLSSINSLIASGFKGVSDTNRNKIIITFRVKTDCNYSSGNYIRASASANIKCGDPIVTYPAISNPLNIKGVTRPYYSLLKIEADSIFPCEKSSKVRVKIINLGPGKTGIEDKYQAVLLQGMAYDSAAYQGIYNAPDNTLTKSRNINGATEVEFSLQNNIIPGDSMEFVLSYNSDGKYLDCGPLDLYSQAAVKQEVICISDSSKCKINVVTGNYLANPVVVKGDLAFSNLRSKILQNSLDSETLNLQYTVTNKGNKVISGHPFSYAIVYDKNGSGTVDKNDLIVQKDTTRLTMGMGASTSVSRKLTVKAGQSCALFIVLDSSSCSCSFGSMRFPVPALKNAGPPKTLCSGDRIVAGLPGTNGYRYLWAPGQDFDNDTIAQPAATINNFDTGAVSRQYVLTTYRGYCTSRDTLGVRVYNLPKLLLLQKDTGICEGKSIILKASSSMGTGTHTIRWTPGTLVNDSTKFTTSSKNIKTQVYKAMVKDAKGCKAADSLKILVNPVPEAKFGYSPTCQGNTLLLKDSSVIAGDSIVFNKWYNLASDTVNSPVWDLDLAPQLKTSVKLEVKSSAGCTDSLRKDVFLDPLPKARFNVNPVCLGDSVSAVNASVVSGGTIARLEWRAGDGQTIFSTNLKYRYQTADTFDITLVVSTNKNCNDTLQKQVFVYPRPKADFNIDGVCLGDSSHLVNKSTIPNDTITGNTWITPFDTVAGYNISKRFTRDTIYPVQLLVISSKGCRDSIGGTAEVYTNPVAGFKTNPVCEKQATKVSGIATIAKGSIDKYNYSLSDGSSFITPDFTHLFAIGDTFLITQVASSAKGCKDTFTGNAIVYPKLLPDFTPKDICVSDSITLADQTTYTNTTIKNWKWKFTVSDSSLVQDPIYKFAKWGSYTVKLVVTSQEGCTYDTSRKMMAYPLPVPDFKDTNRCIDNRFDLEALVSIPYGNVSQVYWNFGDNTGSADFKPVHSFPASGVYKVKLVAISDFGCKDSIEKDISSYPPVIVDFDWKNVCKGDVMFFKDKCQVPNSTIRSYHWDFGDGATDNVANPQHLYTSEGKYNARFSITTAYNCTYDSTHQVEVYPVPAAMFDTDPDEGTIVDPNIRITDQSLGADTLYYSLGDGKTTQLRNLTNSYPDSGVYYIRQYAGNNYGCVDSFTRKIIIHYLFVFNAPTAFSPNGDGKNDTYAPGGIGITTYDMSIFNRWGELIYYTDSGRPWDGMYKGEPVMEGVYAVTFKVKDFMGRSHYTSATVVLLR